MIENNKIIEKQTELLRQQFQSPWVSVKDRMPSIEKNLFGDVTRPSVLVLTASHAGGVSVNRWDGREWLYVGNVDYWMPIPAIPKGDNNDE